MFTLEIIVEMLKRTLIMISLIIITESTLKFWICEPLLSFVRMPALWIIPKVTNEMFEIAYWKFEEVPSIDYKTKNRRRRSPFVRTTHGTKSATESHNKTMAM